MNLPPRECIFLVDDDEDDRFLVQEVFKQQSPECTLKPLHNGSELLKALAETTELPNLILLDLNMPYMGGLEALQQIRLEKKYESVPIVILTTSDQASDKQRAANLKANGYITKPATIEQYNQAVLQLRSKWLAGKCVSEQPDSPDLLGNKSCSASC